MLHLIGHFVSIDIEKKVVILYLGKYSITCLFAAYCSADDFLVCTNDY
jgi:hypothetical protein